MEFKAGDYVLCRDDRDDQWHPAIYCTKLDSVNGVSFDEPHVMFGGQTWRQVVPFKGNEHLLFTSNTPADWEEEPAPEVTEYAFGEAVDVVDKDGKMHRALYIKTSEDKWDPYPHSVVVEDERRCMWCREEQVRRAVRDE